MGRKRTRERQYLLFYIACFMIAILFFEGCASFSSETLVEKDYFGRADFFMNRGNFEVALKEIESKLKERPNIFVDRGLFRIGLIYAHPENKFADVHKAIEFFKIIPEKFPWSPLRETAIQWTLTLQKIEDQKSEISSLKKEISILESQLEESGGINEVLKNKAEVLGSELEKSHKKLKKILKEREESSQLLLDRIKTLEAQLEDLKKIDLGKEGEDFKGATQ